MKMGRGGAISNTQRRRDYLNGNFPAGRLRLVLDVHRVRRGSADAVEACQRARLGAAIAHARTHSRYYGELYRHLPSQVPDITHLPVTDKRTLMSRFDEWVTDPDVTEAGVRTFASDPTRVGERFLERYTIASSSGTTGTPGLFVMDDYAMSVAGALSTRMLSDWLSIRDVLKVVRRKGRMSMIMATGGHFASAVAAARLQNTSVGARLQVLAAGQPITELVSSLNAFKPAVLAPYASIALMLATEQEEQRLEITPALLALSAEGLMPAEYAQIAAAFNAVVGNSYAATECPFISYSCAQGWLHVNSDWVVLEPVDTEYRAVPPGTPSNTVLISNLANRVQPILRYDLGDSVTLNPDLCTCGNPLPAIRVQGRAADVMTVPATNGTVQLTPLAFAAALDAVEGVEQFQIIQVSRSTLHIRLSIVPSVSVVTVEQQVRARTIEALRRHGANTVDVVVVREPPLRSAAGKFRQVLPLQKTS